MHDASASSRLAYVYNVTALTELITFREWDSNFDRLGLIFLDDCTADGLAVSVKE